MLEFAHHVQTFIVSAATVLIIVHIASIQNLPFVGLVLIKINALPAIFLIVILQHALITQTVQTKLSSRFLLNP